MKAYMTRYAEIIEVEVEKWSECSVWVVSPLSGKSRRNAIVSQWHAYHKTREEAVAYVRKKLKEDVSRAEDVLARARRILVAFEEREVAT